MKKRHGSAVHAKLDIVRLNEECNRSFGIISVGHEQAAYLELNKLVDPVWQKADRVCPAFGKYSML